MFFTLLLVTFLIALAVSFIVARGFDASIGAILRRILADDISRAWQQYLRFAIYVVGVSGGVRIYELERYVEPVVAPRDPGVVGPPALTAERWTLEVYRTVIETLQSLAWMLLVFFLFALVAYVVVRAAEAWRESRRPPAPPAA